MRSQLLASFAGLLGASFASPIHSHSVVAKEVFKFPNTTFIENIAIRPNGHLLLDTFDQGRMYSIDPYARNPTPHVVAALSDTNMLTGIVEIEPDVFVVTGGKKGGAYNFEIGTAKIAKIDLNGHKHKTPVFEDIAPLPDAPILNGMIGLPKRPGVVLTVDSIKGKLYRVDASTNEVKVVLHSDKLLGPGNSTLVPLGANGLNIYHGHLYFTNSAQQFFGRIEINEDGTEFGEFEEIYHLPANDIHAYDDFDMTRWGTSYVCSQGDSLVKISQDGEVKTLIGPDSKVKLSQPTSIALRHDEKVAFVVTGGGQVVAVHV